MLIALIVLFCILKSTVRSKTGALFMNLTKSKDMQRVLPSLSILIFHKLSVVDFVFVTVFSSVVGSAPSHGV